MAPPPPTWPMLLREARARFGVKQIRPGQRELIDAVLEGKDALGVLADNGRSLAYELPARFLPKPTVVVSSEGGRDEPSRQDDVQRGCIVYVTPERLQTAEALDQLRATGASLLVIDEAHRISRSDVEFRPAYLAIRNAALALGNPPLLALTPAATPALTKDVLSELGIEGALVVTGGIERPNVFLEVVATRSEEAKRGYIRESLLRERGRALVYVATVRLAEELHEWLRDAGHDVVRYHGKMRAKDRLDALERFVAGRARLLVATNALGCIDRPDLRLVVHYTFPESLETYDEEAGRAGRDGEPARATLLYRREDRRIQAYFAGGKYPSDDEVARVWELVGRTSAGPTSAAAIARATGVPERRARVIIAHLESMGIVERREGRVVKLRDFTGPAELEAYVDAYERRRDDDRERIHGMMRWAEATCCRRQALREYFGAAVEEPCGQCDNCHKPRAGIGAGMPRDGSTAA